jgi:hypothetical protein
MRIGKEFQANPAHRYNLEPGEIVHSAKFGRIQVDIWRAAQPSPIWRGSPPVEVGRASAPLWTYVVQGCMSGTAATQEGAKAKGEAQAWDNQANGRNPSRLYTLTPEQAKAEREAMAAWLADIESRFPVGPGKKLTGWPPR